MYVATLKEHIQEQ